MPTAIRRAAPADAQGLAEVHIRAWHETYAGLVNPEVLPTSMPSTCDGGICSARVHIAEKRMVR